MKVLPSLTLIALFVVAPRVTMAQTRIDPNPKPKLPSPLGLPVPHKLSLDMDRGIS